MSTYVPLSNCLNKSCFAQICYLIAGSLFEFGLSLFSSLFLFVVHAASMFYDSGSLFQGICVLFLHVGIPVFPSNSKANQRTLVESRDTSFQQSGLERLARRTYHGLQSVASLRWCGGEGGAIDKDEIHL